MSKQIETAWDKNVNHIFSKTVLLRFLAFMLYSLTANAVADEIAIPSPAGAMRAFWFVGETSPQQSNAAPVVISLHGCGGQYLANGSLSAAPKDDARRFNAIGVHVLALDGFSHHGQKSICATADANRTITEETRRADLQYAYAWLATQANVDIKKIILIGRSHGAQTVLRSIEYQFIQDSTIRPMTAIALYPGCTKFVKQPRFMIGVPLMLLVGALDDWTRPQPCAQLARSAGTDTAKIVFEEYADSYHGFDGTSALQVRNNIGNTRSGTATVGGNPQARAASHEKIMQLVNQITQ